MILSCGPSLSEYTTDDVKKFCKDKIVLCIKDSVHIYKDICDIFIANQHNDKTYNLDNIPLKIYQKDFTNPKFNKYNIILENENCYRYGKIAENVTYDEINDYYLKNFKKFSNFKTSNEVLFTFWYI